MSLIHTVETFLRGVVNEGDEEATWERNLSQAVPTRVCREGRATIKALNH